MEMRDGEEEIYGLEGEREREESKGSWVQVAAGHHMCGYKNKKAGRQVGWEKGSAAEGTTKAMNLEELKEVGDEGMEWIGMEWNWALKIPLTTEDSRHTNKQPTQGGKGRG